MRGTYLLVDHFKNGLSDANELLRSFVIELRNQVLERLDLIGCHNLLKDVNHSFKIIYCYLHFATLKELKISISHFIVELHEGEVVISVVYDLLELDIVARHFEDGLIFQKSTRNYGGLSSRHLHRSSGQTQCSRTPAWSGELLLKLKLTLPQLQIPIHRQRSRC